MNVPRGPVPYLSHPAHHKTPRTRLGRAIETVLGALLFPIAMLGAFATVLATRSAMTVGVKVTTAARSGSGDVLRAVGSRYFVAGMTEKGSTNTPIRVRSMDEFVTEFGNRVSYGFLTDDLQSYFETGGTEAYVTRGVGAGATKGSATLNDRAGTPLATVVLTAISEGGWSANLTRQVANGDVANTFTITLAYKAGTVDEIIETYRNLDSPATAVSRINGASRLVTATNSGSVTAAPNNNPAVLAVTAFSTGTDDTGSVTATTLVTTLTRFTAALGPGLVAIPGYDISLVGAGIDAHCSTVGNLRIGIAHDVIGSSVSGMKAAFASFLGSANADYIGMVGPWVKIPDGSGGSRVVPPTGAVAGRRAAAHQNSGPWRWPAGSAGLMPFVLGTEFDIDQAGAGTLVDAGVSPIRNLPGVGVELYGWRSGSTQSAYYSLAARDTLNLLAWQVDQVLEGYVYDPIDSKGVSLELIKSDVNAICKTMADAGGLYARIVNGEQIDPGYRVTVTANPSTRSITVTIGVRITEAAELILATITKVASDQAV